MKKTWGPAPPSDPPCKASRPLVLTGGGGAPHPASFLLEPTKGPSCWFLFIHLIHSFIQ